MFEKETNKGRINNFLSRSLIASLGGVLKSTYHYPVLLHTTTASGILYGI